MAIHTYFAHHLYVIGSLTSTSQRTDILSFFLGNYAAHAATVVTYPGESIASTIGAIFFALVFPASGIIRGMTAIIRHAVFVSDPLEQAARAGALCMVVRTKDWLPTNGQRLDDAVWRTEMHQEAGKEFRLFNIRYKRPDKFTFANKRVSDAHTLDFRFYWPPWMWEMSSYWQFLDTLSGFVSKSKKIHGFYTLTPGYALAHVPRDAVVLPSTSPHTVNETCTISTNYSMAKALVAIIQLCFACITLSRNAGTEVADNGYGSYNLTVVQYALMSLLNLIGTTVNPTYPSLFLVSSEIMDEAIQRGSIFDGVVGKLVPDKVDIAGIEGNKISGVIRVTEEVTQVTTKILPKGWEERATPDGRAYFVDHFLRRTTHTEPSVELDIKATKTLNIFFRPEFISDAQVASHMTTELRNFHHPTLTKVVAHQAIDDHFPNNDREYQLTPTSNRPDDRPDAIVTPSLFIPCCPSFKRKNHNSYAVHYHRTWPNSMDMIHFVGVNANRIGVIGALLTQYGSLVLAGLTLAIIAAFTGFKKGESSLASRVIFMTWLAVGMFMGSGIHNVVMRLRRGVLWLLWGVVAWCLPAGLGFYQVVVDLQRYGTCIRIW